MVKKVSTVNIAENIMASDTRTGIINTGITMVAGGMHLHGGFMAVLDMRAITMNHITMPATKTMLILHGVRGVIAPTILKAIPGFPIADKFVAAAARIHSL